MTNNRRDFLKTLSGGCLVLASGGLATLLTGCTTTQFIDNYQEPQRFYSAIRGSQGLSNAEIVSTLGIVVYANARNENEALAGNVLANIGAMRAQREAAEAGRANVNVQQNVVVSPNPAVADALRVPEYDLGLLSTFYRDGHLLYAIETDHIADTIGGGALLREVGLDLRDKGMARVNGLQYIFTYNRKIDLNGDGRFSFGEFSGIKKNFLVGESLEVCVGLSESAMRVGKKVSPSKMRPTNVNLYLRIFNEKNELLYEDQHESRFTDFDQTRLFFWGLNELELDPGFYMLEAEYTDDFDEEADIRFYRLQNVMMNKADMPGRRIKTLRQFFQILE